MAQSRRLVDTTPRRQDEEGLWRHPGRAFVFGLDAAAPATLRVVRGVGGYTPKGDLHVEQRGRLVQVGRRYRHRITVTRVERGPEVDRVPVDLKGQVHQRPAGRAHVEDGPRHGIEEFPENGAGAGVPPADLARRRGNPGAE